MQQTKHLFLFILVGILTACFDTSTTTATTSGSTTIPASLQKQYNLNYSGSNQDNLANGSSYIVTIASDNSLTIGSTVMSNPKEEDIFGTGSKEITWRNGDYAYGLSTKTDGSFNEINIYDTTKTLQTGAYLGQLSDKSRGGTSGSGGTSGGTGGSGSSSSGLTGNGEALGNANGITGVVDGKQYTYTVNAAYYSDRGYLVAIKDISSNIVNWTILSLPSTVGTFNCGDSAVRIILNINRSSNYSSSTCTVEIISVSSTEIEGRFSGTMTKYASGYAGGKVTVTDGYFRYKISS